MDPAPTRATKSEHEAPAVKLSLDKKCVRRFVQADQAQFVLTKLEAKTKGTTYLVAWDWRLGFHRVLVDVDGTWSPVGLIRHGNFTVNDDAAAWLTLGAFHPSSPPWAMARDVLHDLERKRPVIRHADELRLIYAIFGLRPMELNPTDVKVRRFDWLWRLLDSEIPLPHDLVLLHPGPCARCQAVLTNEVDLERGHCSDCAHELLKPSLGLRRLTEDQLAELRLDKYTPWLADSPFLPPGYEPPPVPLELLEPPDNPTPP